MRFDYFPHFQPIVDVYSMSIAGYEALARTYDGSGKVMSLGAAFADPNFDREELLQIDRCVRSRALAQLAASQQDVFLSLNVLPEWMRQVTVNAEVPTIAMARDYGVPGNRVLIEFVESAGDLENMRYLLSRYREKGMRIAVDDFGAGASNMDRVISLEPDIIKLDMALFKQAMQGGVSEQVVQSVGFLAQRTGSELLCEGVETEQEFFFALDCGARYIQGYFFWPAQSGFLATDAPRKRLEPLLARYAERRVAVKEAQLLDYYQVERYFNDACARVGATTVPVESLALPPRSLQRLYLCDNSGIQLSPNYEFRHGDEAGQWQEDASNCGMNWSMRPYFHEVLASASFDEPQRVMSSPYRDMRGGALCRTLARMLPGGRILLADVDCSDEEGGSIDAIKTWPEQARP